MAQSGFFDQISSVSVGPLVAGMVEKTRRSCEGDNARGEVIFSYIIRDDEQFDCTYAEWVQNHRAKTIGQRVQHVIEHMGADLGLNFVPWDAVVAVAATRMDDKALRQFLADLCWHMAAKTDNAAHKTAWTAKQARYEEPHVAAQG